MDNEYSMENPDNMDDLFGDGEQFSLAPGAASVPQMLVKGLAERLDELHTSGCCQKIAWSKLGCVASVTRDGREVEFRSLVRRPEDGRWELSKKQPLRLDYAHDGSYITHLSWGLMGTDLAVVDNCGRISLFTNTFTFVLGRMQAMAKNSISEPESELSAVVGLHWLSIIPHFQKRVLYHTADRSGDQWNFRMSFHQSFDAHNPVSSKAALIYTTRNGTVKLLYQPSKDSSQWREATTELPGFSSAQDLLTHAAFTSDNDGSLLLAVHNLNRHLYLYRITISWSPTYGPSPNPKIPPPVNSVTPTLEAVLLKREDGCAPLDLLPQVDDPASNLVENVPVPAQLTHLQCVPASPDYGRGPTAPTIVAIFSSNPNPHSALDHITQHQQAFSTIVRWEIQQVSETSLHSGFDLLANKKKPTSTFGGRKLYRLARQPDVPTSAIILSTSSAMQLRILACQLSDGSIEFRDRTFMDLINADYADNSVDSFPQTGFSFPLAEPGAGYLAFSPNLCIAAAVQKDGTLILRRLEYSLGSLNIAEKNHNVDAAIAAIVLQHSNACTQYQTSDDIFASVAQELGPVRTRQLLNQIYRAMSLNLDFLTNEKEHAQTLLKGAALGKCLSAQNLLRDPADEGTRTLSGKLAWCILSIRSHAFVFIQTFRHDQPPEPDLAKSLVGLVKWSNDFLVYIVDELMELARAVRGQEHDRAFVQEKVNAANSPALLLLLASAPRYLLRMLLRPLQLCFKTVHAALKQPSLPRAQKVVYETLNNIFMTNPISSPRFEHIVPGEVDKAVRDAYAAANLSAEQRGAAEKAMLVNAEIPECLMPAVKQLLTGTLPKLLSELQDTSKIYFADLKWLGLHDGWMTREFLRHRAVDVVRKVQLGREKKLRMCTRCGAVMEDLPTPAEGRSELGWLMFAQKSCVCMSNWVAVGNGDA
ncbi:Mediator of RNA polymerase II transcription subunit 16 [Coniosporium apollinis]|uniref:Mediator of RNA polymerase II transcription subunit 16 n=1 Tax=Coniosporium apollinis TaxID=61459 RepID=A0ABQ9P251_9PEZI|nr:Mediator of RNA polymerase II transcription subunit 16 [Coniosporium apollinis]